jgi:hypothetical protein
LTLIAVLSHSYVAYCIILIDCSCADLLAEELKSRIAKRRDDAGSINTTDHATIRYSALAAGTQVRLLNLSCPLHLRHLHLLLPVPVPVPPTLA